MTAPVVGVDLGGTKIFGVRLDHDGHDAATAAVAAEVKRPTPAGTADDVAATIAEVVQTLDDAPRAVGIGTPGVVRPDSGVVLYAPNLPGFDRPVPLADLVAERVGAPVVLANDVNAAAYGEVGAGAARGFADVLAVWLGTGLGAGLVLDGRLRVGPAGLAGELGHAVVVPGGRRCACGGQGHVEAYIGRRAMEARARELHAAGRTTSLVDRAGDKVMKSRVFAEAYAEGDEVAVELIDEGLEMLAVAVANAIVTVDVSAVVVGGGLGDRLGEAALARLRSALEVLRFAGDPPTVVGAALGDHAGAVGAGLLAATAVPAGTPPQ